MVRTLGFFLSSGLFTCLSLSLAQEASIPSLLVLSPSSQKATLSLGGENKLIVKKGGIAVNATYRSAVFNANSTIQVVEGGLRVGGGSKNA